MLDHVRWMRVMGKATALFEVHHEWYVRRSTTPSANAEGYIRCPALALPAVYATALFADQQTTVVAVRRGTFRIRQNLSGYILAVSVASVAVYAFALLSVKKLANRE